MDVQAVRDRLLTGFKPKEKDISTPYLEDLDGELKLVGLSGKQRIALEEQASSEIIDREGNVTSTFSAQKFIALAAAECLRLRSTGEKILSPADVLGESGNGDGALFEAGDQAIRPLLSEIAAFIGNKSLKENKETLKKTSDDSNGSSSLHDSAEPLENSLIPLTVQS